MFGFIENEAVTAANRDALGPGHDLAVRALAAHRDLLQEVGRKVTEVGDSDQAESLLAHHARRRR
jgi:hypothetical protein